MPDPARQAAGQKGGAARRDLVPLCPYCKRRPPYDPKKVHGCVQAQIAERAAVQRELDTLRTENELLIGSNASYLRIIEEQQRKILELHARCEAAEAQKSDQEDAKS